MLAPRHRSACRHPTSRALYSPSDPASPPVCCRPDRSPSPCQCDAASDSGSSRQSPRALAAARIASPSLPPPPFPAATPERRRSRRSRRLRLAPWSSTPPRAAPTASRLRPPPSSRDVPTAAHPPAPRLRTALAPTYLLQLAPRSYTRDVANQRKFIPHSAVDRTKYDGHNGQNASRLSLPGIASRTPSLREGAVPATLRSKVVR